jgi:predicted O-methyltransferase YrrM
VAAHDRHVREVIGRSIRAWALHAIGVGAACTQLTEAERTAVAKHARNRRRLVEIGVMHGATTRLLCDVKAPDGVVYGIDPFQAGRLGISFERLIAIREVRRSGKPGVRFLRALSTDAAVGWTTPIDFLFIDGDHSWQGISDDWRLWAPWISPGGIVALHDSCSVPGRADQDSVRFTNEVVLPDPRFRAIDQVDSLTVLERIASP